MLQQLRENFEGTKTYMSKLTILTLIPKDWSVRKDSVTHTAKQLLKECGILASPNPKSGRNLYPEVYTVEKFHCHDIVNTIMPGRKDYVTAKTGCIKECK
jgi:hypothetical protein